MYDAHRNQENVARAEVVDLLAFVLVANLGHGGSAEPRKQITGNWGRYALT